MSSAAPRVEFDWKFPAFSQAEERAFQNQYAAQIATFWRVFHPYGAALYLIYLFWDWTLDPEVAQKTAPWRAGAALFVLATLIATYHRRFPQLRERLCFLTTIVMSLVLAYVLYLVPRGFELGTSGMMLCLIFSLGMWRLRPASAVVAYVVILAACNALMAAKSSDHATVVSTNMMLVSAFGLCLLYHHLLELQSRRFFQLESSLRLEKQRIEGLLQEVQGERQERLGWLENLAGFLRHEMSNQMIGVRSSLDLLEKRGVERSTEYLSRARRSVHVMQTLLESAGEATSLETMLEDDEFERFDAVEVVAAWAETVVDAAPDRIFSVEMTPSAVVWGVEDRLIQILDKLLQNALEHSGSADRIGIRAYPKSESVLIEVWNEGDPIPRESERMFQPFTSGLKRVTDGHNLGIGLYVARLISERLGGTLIAEPLSPQGGALFRLSLPLDSRGE